MYAIKLRTPELGEISHKPMWVLPDGSVAVQDGIELIVLGKEDFFKLLHHGRVTGLALYSNADVPDIIEGIGTLYDSWPPLKDAKEILSWSDLVEDEAGESSGSVDTTLPVESGGGQITEPPKEEKGKGKAIPPSPATENRLFDEISGRIVPVPLIVGKPETSHPVFKNLKEGGGTLPYPYSKGIGVVYRDVPYKRVRLGQLSYREIEPGNTAIEMDPLRVDISTGPGVSTRLHKSFSLFK